MKRNTTQNLFLRYDDIYSCIIAKLLNAMIPYEFLSKQQYSWKFNYKKYSKKNQKHALKKDWRENKDEK